MKKKFIIIMAVVVLIGLVVFAIYFSQGQQIAETQGKSNNPIFHTVIEGGICRDGMGDCAGGLTCSDGICAKPQ